MTPVDGVASANTLLGFGTCQPGYCLRYTWDAFAANGAVSQVGTIPTAYDAWLASPEGDRRSGDRNPPAGVPVYWGPKASSRAGDIVISLGGGQVVATDWPHNGVIGVTTIDQRERQIGRPYLGWTTSILGYPIAYPGTPDLTALGDLMSLRIIESPSYVAAGYRVIHNGSAATSVPAGWVQDMITKGHVDFASYDDDNLLNTEVSLVWTLGGLDNDSAAAKTAAMLDEIKQP